MMAAANLKAVENWKESAPAPAKPRCDAARVLTTTELKEFVNCCFGPACVCVAILCCILIEWVFLTWHDVWGRWGLSLGECMTEILQRMRNRAKRHFTCPTLVVFPIKVGWDCYTV
jgi:hypothetical protein